MPGLLFFSLNGLRGDIDTLRSDTSAQISELRSDMDTQIGELRSEIGMLRGDMDRRLGEINAVLLDHTDRLARIETHLDLIRSTHPTQHQPQPTTPDDTGQ